MGVAGRAGGFVRSVGLAGLCSGALVAAASGAAMLTTAGEWLTVTLEPLSLLLLPGMLCAMVVMGLLGMVRHAGNLGYSRGFEAHLIAGCSVVFYFAVFAWWFSGRTRGRRNGNGGRTE